MRTTKTTDIIKVFVEFYKLQLSRLLSDTIEQYRRYTDIFRNSTNEKKMNCVIKAVFGSCDVFEIGYILPPTYLLCLMQAKNIIDTTETLTSSENAFES